MASVTANFSIQFNGSTPTEAANIRTRSLTDFAKFQGLDIWTDETKTTVDNSKVIPAVTVFLSAYVKQIAKQWRVAEAERAVKLAEEAQADIELSLLAQKTEK